MRENYIDRGVEFEDAVQNTAKDLSMHPDEVRRDITTRQTRPITDQMYLQMARRRQAQSAARQWVRNVDKSIGAKALDAVSDAFFNIKIAGGLHGTVGPVTHAGENIFHPTRWVDYFKNVGRTWKAGGSQAAHERYMQDLLNDPNYATARRAGLANEPHRFYDDFQNNQLNKIFGRGLGEAGNRGFDILKTMRQDFFNSRWEKLSPEQRTPEMAKVIADLVNHSTGAIRTQIPQGRLARLAFFAPPLEASRWARIVGDPAKATNTFLNWRKSTQADRYFAKAVVKNHAGFLATYLSALALNQAILKASGSDDKVNFTDPSKGDWLRIKVKGRSIEPTGGLISTMTFLTRLLSPALNPVRAKYGMEPAKVDTGDVLYKYVRGKLSPIAGAGEDVRSGVDFSGRPMPWSHNEKGDKGQPRLSWPEYLAQQGPIPTSEGAREFFEEMQNQGVPVETLNQVFNAIKTHPGEAGVATGIAATSGGTGIRISPEYVPHTTPAGRGRREGRGRR